jgi:aryl carrier-like protein
MVPRYLVFLETLPLTAQGKVDRRALPEPQSVRPDFTQEFIAPVGPVEELLAEIWGRVLGVDRVGREDNFFDLGGDSIRGLQVVGQARSTGMNVRLQDINRYPTLGTLAEITEQLKATAPAAPAKPVAKPSPFALLSERDRARLAARGSSTK